MHRAILLALFSLVVTHAGGLAATVPANFTSAASIPVTAAGYTAAGNDLDLILGFAPATGTDLMVVQNTGPGVIDGRFSNLAQGQQVALAYQNLTYQFVASYYGGTGNDLVLHWADRRAYTWGDNYNGQLGVSSTFTSRVPLAAATGGALAGKVVATVVAGDDHCLALCEDGTLAAWGRGESGQLGDNTMTDSGTPVAVTQSGVLAGKTVVEVAAGRSHNLALCSDGTVATWGNNYSGQLGNGTVAHSSVPVAVTTTGALAGKTVVAVAAGESHSLALCSDGSLIAWGRNSQGELGYNSTNSYSSVPVAVTTTGALAGKTVVAVAAGDSHSLALCSDGTMAAWGNNYVGQLGNISSDISRVPVAVTVTGALAGRTVVAMAAGDSHSLALCSDGTVAAWGDNHSGQLGDNSVTSSSVPVAVTMNGALAGKTVVALDGGFNHSLALCSDGTMAAWGLNNSGQLGNDGAANSSVPVAVTTTGVLAGKTVVAVKVGGFFSLALCSDGTLATWGSNNYGQLGDNSTPKSSVPVTVTHTGVLDGKTVVAVAAGDYHNLALCADNTLVAWGSNGSGQLGNGTTTDSSAPVVVNPSGVLADKTVIAVAAGGSHSLALCSDGTVAAWGSNTHGQLGDNSTADSSVPVAVSTAGLLAGKTVVAVAAGATVRGGGSHSLALCSDGTVAAWGYNAYGQLGNNSMTDSSVPVAVSSSGILANKTVVAVAAGESHSLALCSDGTVTSWGANSYGKLGNNSTTNSSVPVAVTTSGMLSGKMVVMVAAGSSHSLALCADGTMAAWGRNIHGQLGNDSATDSSVPVAVNHTEALTGKTVVTVEAGTSHNLALCSDGTAVAWGNNALGQLGDSSRKNRGAPVTVVNTGVLTGSRFAALAAGASHSLSIAAAPLAAVFNDSSLSALSLDAGSLSPVFSPGISSYSASVPNAASSIKVTLGLSNPNATAKINGIPLTPESSNQPIALSVGNNIIAVEVTAENGITTSTYEVTVHRAPSPVATLSGLKLSSAILTPSFTPACTSYEAGVGNTVSSIKITPTLTEPNATVEINGAPASSGNASTALPLVVGLNMITVRVMAQDGISIKTYTIKVTRAKSSDAMLAGLTVKTTLLSPAFKPGNTSYSATVAKSTTSVRVKATTRHSAATIRINGHAVVSGSPSKALPLALGKNVIKIVVKAQDGTTKTYKVTVTRGKTRAGKPAAAANRHPLAATLKKTRADEARVSKVVVDGKSYLQLTVPRPVDGSKPIIEVSPNLVDWYRGTGHTTTLVDDTRILQVRDNTPVTPETKRFIRVREEPR